MVSSKRLRKNFFSTTTLKKEKTIDEKIASEASLQPIASLLAEKLGLSEDDFSPHGWYMAKLRTNKMQLSESKHGKLILVTAMSPTKFGEGKTCTSVGLNDGLNLLNDVTSIAALREPSLGPVFGVKGGAAGGGHAQVVPMESINLSFTGDMHAIGAAHNLLSAMLDNHLHWDLEPKSDVRRIEWGRVVDMNDRALRDITVGLGGTGNGIPRQDSYQITVASEVMAAFCLATNLEDLQRRLGNMIVGYTRGGKEAITCKEIGADGAMTAILKDAFEPNVVQSLEGNLALIHGGPFANIAHGNSSLIATKTALNLADFVVTEAGFGADLGAEKFFDIKCRKGDLEPSCAVIVATVRALKLHGGADVKNLTMEDVNAIEKGMPNLARHIENIAKFGVPSVVSINRFPSDTDAEIEKVQELCSNLRVEAVLTEQWQHGGKGAKRLAEVVREIAEKPKEKPFKFLYSDDLGLLEKVETIATELYKASGVEISKAALTKLKKFEKDGFAHLPVCVAKTQYSFSDDPKLLNAPVGHMLHVQDVRLAAGAEFVIILTGDIMTMPGLPKRPSALDIGVDSNGEIYGLF